MTWQPDSPIAASAAPAKSSFLIEVAEKAALNNLASEPMDIEYASQFREFPHLSDHRRDAKGNLSGL
jgi:hypothetical protein